MPLVKVIRNGQITLPAPLRKAFTIKDGDYLEAEIVGGAIALRPVTVVDRQKAWDELARIIDKPKLAPDAEPMTPDAEEQMIFEEMEAYRHRDA